LKGKKTMSKKIHVTEIKGISEGAWIWCLHCERCYKAGEYRVVKGLQMCPYDDCNGDTVLDAHAWEGIRSMHLDYPEVPERGKEYPMYPTKEL
jgi:hypothetical protein